MDLLDIRFWAGTESSLLAYVELVTRLMADPAVMAKADVYSPQAQEPRAPRLFSKQGDIGVITIAGSLNNSDSWMNAYLNMTGYPEIRDAMIYAAGQEGVKSIALDIKSGGGAVSGVSDTADLISMIDARVKPVYAYSDGMIASAAYWIGAAARTLDIGKTTEAGSIGVLVVHQEQSKMLADMGITVNVIRSGKFKALGNSAEPLSDLAKETIQAQVDQLNGMFVAHVAQARGKTAAIVEAQMGQGRMFIGQDAVDIGLVDAVSNFDAFMSKVQGGIDSQKNLSKYGANSAKGITLKNALTEQQIAAMAAGAIGAPAATVVLTPEQTAAAVAEAAASAEAAAAAASEAATAAAAAAEAAKAVANPDVVTLLQTQLATAQAQVLSLSIELQGAKTQGEANSAAAEKMRPIVRASVGNLRVALGGTAAGVEALADEGLMAEHANLAAQFTTKFKAGGVAAVSSTAAAEDAVDEVGEAQRQARLSAVRNTTNPSRK